MARLGILTCHKRSKTHPKMRPYIGATKNEVELLDPEATLHGLRAAKEMAQKIIAQGGVILCVGTVPAAKEIVKTFAVTYGFPYVTNRWIGGTLTNFSIIMTRLKYYLDLQMKKERGDLAKYTKKEQGAFGKDINAMSKLFEGLRTLTRLPDALLIVDIDAHATAVREARQLHIPVIALLDTDDDPTMVTVPIFANDHSVQSIRWVFEKIQEGILRPQSGIKSEDTL